MQANVGVIDSFLGAVDGRPAIIVVIGGATSRKAVECWVKQTYQAQLEMYQACHRGVVDFLDLEFLPFFDIFIDGQWGWPFYGRTLQVLQCTLPHPMTLRGYVTAMVIMDVKSAADYIKALTSFVTDVKAAIVKLQLDPDECVRWHCDEEDALIGALESLMCGGSVVGCRFHKGQNAERQLKMAFPKNK